MGDGRITKRWKLKGNGPLIARQDSRHTTWQRSREETVGLIDSLTVLLTGYICASLMGFFNLVCFAPCLARMSCNNCIVTDVDVIFVPSIHQPLRALLQEDARATHAISHLHRPYPQTHPPLANRLPTPARDGQTRHDSADR